MNYLTPMDLGSCMAYERHPGPCLLLFLPNIGGIQNFVYSIFKENNYIEQVIHGIIHSSYSPASKCATAAQHKTNIQIK